MRRQQVSQIILAAAIFSTGASAKAPTAPPQSGVYAANILIVKADGLGCLDAKGNRFAGVLNYGGISGTQLGLRIPISDHSGVAVVSTQVLTVKSGIGTTQPSGTFVWRGAGEGAHWNLSGTFSSTLIEVDVYSFAADVSEDYTAGGYSCDEEQLISLTRLGPQE